MSNSSWAIVIPPPAKLRGRADIVELVTTMKGVTVCFGALAKLQRHRREVEEDGGIMRRAQNVTDAGIAVV